MNRDWTIAGLAAVYALSSASIGLGEIAEAVGRSRGEVDLALWCLVGRTPEQALAVLATTGAPAVHSRLGRFIQETLP
ncbi:hypothetical protein [Caulobacter sp. BP25]|uniref:hypothetical protein n=1 Tax=Caulobacter sp. BP25 TaxID=2048900 RepID=UPI000C12DE41|nr:hypothetical protein [Caulobacter sp. BP25]PHY20786.1 hypothetical protein CSW59_06065 [Caulobacter sp. BP25]